VSATLLVAAGTRLLDSRVETLYGPQRDPMPSNPGDSDASAGEDAGREHIIERPRLTRLLDDATAPVIMLVAPAGYGKTTLARQWLAGRRRGWYRGSPASADVAALAVGLARSASAIVPDAGRRMGERLRATGTPEQDVEPLAELLAEDLEEWPTDAWLAFDDYHFASESTFAEEFVERVLALCPLKLFLTSRKRPSWATSRRLLYGGAYEIGRSLLSMSQEEAELVLANRRGSEVSGLVALADGWPAVIGLAALTDDLEPPDQDVPEALYAYFAEELYQAADEDLRWHLSQLALSSTVTTVLADSLLGGAAERAVRDGRRLGFITSSEQDGWEMHPLLRTFLEEKFRELAGDTASEIVEQLVRVHIRERGWDDAFSLVERFFDPTLLVELFEAALPSLLLEARLPTVARWIECARHHAVDAPVLDLAEGELAFREGDRGRSEALALQSARRFPDDHVLLSQAWALAGASAHRACRDTVSLEHYSRAEDTAKGNTDRIRAVWGRFLAMIGLEREEASTQALKELAALDDTSADGVLRLCNGELMLATLRGDIREPLEQMRTNLALIERAIDPMVQSSALNSCAATLVLAGRYEEAHAVAKKELALVEEYRLTFARPHALLYQASALWGMRRFKQSMEMLNDVRKSCGNDQFLLMNVGVVLARIYLALSSPDRALRALEDHLDIETTPGMEAEYEAWWGLVLACSGQHDGARTYAAAALGRSQRVEVVGVVPWIEVVMKIDAGAGDAQAAVVEALSIGRTAGNLDGFVAAYRARHEILQLAASDRARHRELRSVLSRAHDPELARRVGLRIGRQDTPTTANLSPRERDVLNLLVQGSTNREIGQTLFISEFTVKAHLRHVYAKMGVRSRSEAIVKAIDANEGGLGNLSR
jgi:LuxR family maltose regulon positive regulatory protein